MNRQKTRCERYENSISTPKLLLKFKSFVRFISNKQPSFSHSALTIRHTSGHATTKCTSTGTYHKNTPVNYKAGLKLLRTICWIINNKTIVQKSTFFKKNYLHTTTFKTQLWAVSGGCHVLQLRDASWCKCSSLISQERLSKYWHPRSGDCHTMSNQSTVMKSWAN